MILKMMTNALTTSEEVIYKVTKRERIYDVNKILQTVGLVGKQT